MGWLYFLFALALFANVSAVSIRGETSEPTFETEYGTMVGLKIEASDVFLGVPFAKPPVGDLRFKDPEPLEKSSSMQFETKTRKSNCMQSNKGSPEGDEDCLYMNIFKPSTPASEGPLPVLVFFPGGNFMLGGCSSGGLYDATILAPDIDAIVVCANYRLGAFGFLYYKDEEAGSEGEILGNFGMNDQTTALKFIKENIGNLGGDPEKITISGESAGAQSVEYHLTSKQDKDLFQQGIMMSGPFGMSFKTEDEALQLSKLFVKELGCKGSTLSCFKESSAEDILTASENSSLMKYDLDNVFSSLFGILRDLRIYFNNKATHMAQPWGPTVTVQPMTQFKNVDKPVIMGTLSGEFRFFATSVKWVELLSIVLPGHGRDIIKEYRNAGYEDEEIFVQFTTDYIFTCPARSMALDVGSSPVYHYYFDHVLSFAGEIYPGHCDEYACHGEDLPFFFQSDFAMNLEFTEDEKKLVDIFSALLANFVHNGDPNMVSGDAQPELSNVVPWTPIESNDLQTMVFSTEEPVKCKLGVRQEQCDFLDGIGYYDVRIMNRK